MWASILICNDVKVANIMTIENSYIFSMEEILAMDYLQLANLGVSSVGPSLMHGITSRDENRRSQRKSSIHTNFKELKKV